MSTSAMESCIYSVYGDDPDLGELVVMFVDEMDGRIQGFQSAFDKRDFSTLRTLAHQLKGAAGSYGFDLLTPAAFELETAVRNSPSPEQVQPALERLIALCRRTRSGVPS